MKKYTNEFKVGIFFILCVAGLVYMSFATGKMDVKREGYHLFVVFDEIAGLDTKAPVMLNGREVGKVDGIDISYENDTTRIILTLWLPKEVNVWDEAVISIKTLGLMGEKYIQIASKQGTKFLEAGATVEGKPYMDLDVLMDEAQGVTKDVGTLVTNVNTLTDEVKKLASNLNYTVEGNQDKISEIVANLETTSANMEEFSADIKAHPWKLLFKEKQRRAPK